MKKLVLHIAIFAFAVKMMAQIPTNGLMGYYNFNNSNTRDTSSNKRHSYGGFTFGTDRNGNSNSAFAGGRCGIQMPTPNGGGLTISCWVNFNSYSNQTTDYPMIASTGVYIFDNNNNQLGFLAKYLMYGQKATQDSFIPRLDLYYGANGFNALGVGVDCGKLLKAGTWYHLTATHSNADSSIKWYVNGAFVNESKLLGPLYLFTGMARTEDNYDVIGDLIIGGSSRGIFNGVNRLNQGSIFAHNSFGGKIDEFLIYDRGFSKQECINLYNHFTGGASTQKLSSAAKISVYPNPTHSVLNISTTEKISSIEILDMTGKIIETDLYKLIDNSIEVGNLPNGIYLLKINNMVHKFIKE